MWEKEYFKERREFGRKVLLHLCIKGRAARLAAVGWRTCASVRCSICSWVVQKIKGRRRRDGREGIMLAYLFSSAWAIVTSDPVMAGDVC